MAADISGAVGIYSRALEYVRAAGLDAEVEWQRNTNFEHFTESDLLRVTAWVILCSGFRESFVRRVFDYISLCFCDWESASAIISARSACKSSAKSAFRNNAKLDAILSVASTIHASGFQAFKNAIMRDPLCELQRLPFIGPVTVLHLVKNLGLNVAKPDRHLVRLSNGLGFRDAEELCSAIANASGEEAKVVDLIVWRYLADNRSAR